MLEHFGPIKEAACLFKRDIQFARLFEKIVKKRGRERKNIAFRANVFGGRGVVTAWFTANQAFSTTVSVVIFCLVRLVISLEMCNVWISF